MKDNINFKGHFKIQAIDESNNVIDEWEDNNMIMESARYSMAEMFANLNSSTFINQFKIGSLGHVGDNIILPKGTNEGFVKERTRMFSETEPVGNLDVIASLMMNDVVLYAEDDHYYQYIGASTTDYTISSASVFLDTENWTDLGETAPYYYTLDFQLPRTSAETQGDPSTMTGESDSYGNSGNTGSEVLVKQDMSNVTFTIDIATASANLQNGTSSIFTEASLLANDRIFAMKTFKAKVKDSTVLLRIIWTITF
jgi:hypothetical protein